MLHNSSAHPQSYSQEQTEDSVCTFIQNIVTNKYDETGEILLEPDGWQAYIPDVRTMTEIQKFALSCSVILTVALLFYSCILHRSLSKNHFSWYPRGRRGYVPTRGLRPGDATKLQRNNSGIIQGRSRSGQSGTSIEFKDGISLT